MYEAFNSVCGLKLLVCAARPDLLARGANAGGNYTHTHTHTGVPRADVNGATPLHLARSAEVGVCVCGCFTAALLLLCCCFAAALLSRREDARCSSTTTLLLLYCCFTAALLSLLTWREGARCSSTTGASQTSSSCYTTAFRAQFKLSTKRVRFCTSVVLAKKSTKTDAAAAAGAHQLRAQVERAAPTLLRLFDAR